MYQQGCVRLQSRLQRKITAQTDATHLTTVGVIEHAPIREIIVCLSSHDMFHMLHLRTGVTDATTSALDNVNQLVNFVVFLFALTSGGSELPVGAFFFE